MHVADVAVFPASQSVMWQQTIGSGLPLIVGDAGGQDTSYLNLNDNLRILAKDEIGPDNLRAAMTDLPERPEKSARMAAGARQTAREKLTRNDRRSVVWGNSG